MKSSSSTIAALKADITEAKAHLKLLEAALQLVQGPKRLPHPEVITPSGEVLTSARRMGFTDAVREVVAARQHGGTAVELHSDLQTLGRTEDIKRTSTALWAGVKRGEFKAIGTPRVFSVKKGKK